MSNSSRDGTLSLMGVFLIASLIFPALLIVVAVIGLFGAAVMISGKVFTDDGGNIGEPEDVMVVDEESAP